MIRASQDGKYARREDVSGAIDGTCESTEPLAPSLKRAAPRLEMTEELAELLSTSDRDLDERPEITVHGDVRWGDVQSRL